MKLAIPKGNCKFHLLTNEGIDIGDKVFPLLGGYSYDGEWYLTDVSIPLGNKLSAEHILAITGWPSEPHTVRAIVKPTNEPLRIYTDKGYSPAQCYFKKIKENK